MQKDVGLTLDLKVEARPYDQNPVLDFERNNGQGRAKTLEDGRLFDR